MNRIVFLILFLDCLLPAYGNSVDFCIFTLHAMTFLNSFIGGGGERRERDWEREAGTVLFFGIFYIQD